MENFTKLPELQKQLEYYLGDVNLSRDQFFYSKIQENDEGWLDLELIERCNKIKSFNCARSDIIAAIEQSELLEASEDGTQIRRAGNKELPEFRAQKKLKTQGGAVAVNNQEQAVAEEQENPDVLKPVILFIRDVAGVPKKGRDIEEALGEKFQIKIPFVRIGGDEDGGHLVLDKFATPQTVIDELVEKGFEYNEKTLKFDLGTDRDRDAFFKEHGNHVGRIIKRKFKKKLGNPKRDQKKKWVGALEFDGTKYPSLEAFKSRFKGLITKTKNGSEIPEDGKNLLAALLKHHKNSEAKLKDMTGFTVDFHPTFKDTRCFFVLKGDGTKQDFSYHKCIHNLVNSRNN